MLLTVLADDCHGGLLMDSEVLTLKEEKDYKEEHLTDSPLVIEWRGLTVALMDQVFSLVRSRLKLNRQEFPLPKVLEGGTRWAGYKMAQEKRKTFSSPLNISSDYTIL